jgi:hypothetical protein
VSTKVIFWNSAEYGNLCGDDFTSAEICAVLFTEFRLRNFINKFMQEILVFFCINNSVEFKNFNFVGIYLLLLMIYGKFSFQIKNLTFSCLYEKFEVTETKLCEIPRNSTKLYIPRHGILNNS